MADADEVRGIIGLLLIAPAVGVAQPAAAVPQGPPRDTLFDCRLREAMDAQLAPELWSAASDDVERFGWLIAGETSVFYVPDDTGSMDYSGSRNVFVSGGAYSTYIDWPHRVEIGTASTGGPDSQRRDIFKTLEIDPARNWARVVVINYEWPHGGDDDDEFVTGGYFGECALVEGEAAIRQLEEIR